LDAIISVGYRVNSSRATQFRIWATTMLKEYIIKGFALGDERMKNGRYFGQDYFRELLERFARSGHQNDGSISRLPIFLPNAVLITIQNLRRPANFMPMFRITFILLSPAIQLRKLSILMQMPTNR